MQHAYSPSRPARLADPVGVCSHHTWHARPRIPMGRCRIMGGYERMIRYIWLARRGILGWDIQERHRQPSLLLPRDITGGARLRLWRLFRSRTDAADLDMLLTLKCSRQCNGTLDPHASKYEGSRLVTTIGPWKPDIGSVNRMFLSKTSGLGVQVMYGMISG